MKAVFFNRASRRIVRLAAVGVLAAGTAQADSHGISMYGEPALPPGFDHRPYVNPDAPTGGRIVTAAVGGFDSLNPYIQKGNVHWQLRYLTGESLMGRSLDEPFTLYGVLASAVRTADDRSWVEFDINPAAEFSDGSPVTADDVIWSFETLGTEGHGRYRGFWEKVESLEAVDEDTVRFTFNVEDSELALLAGMRPILKKSQWDDTDFGESGLDVIPITSSEYVIDDFDAGRFISLKRNPDYWGADLPFMRGVGNLDEIRLEFFGDETAAFEAFKTGEVNSTREFNVAVWESQYDFPLMENGTYTQEIVPHGRPSGMTGFVMNSRKPAFQDWRVREAMLSAFNFEFINEAMTGSQQERITSYWSNSPLAMSDGPAEGRVLDFLEPFADDLLPGAIEGYALPVADGTERNRAGTGTALALMEEAGYSVQDGVMTGPDGQPFTFDILLEQGSSENQAIIDMFVEGLNRMGVSPTVSTVDSAQFNERTDVYDFDMTYQRLGLSLSPGNEQNFYFGSASADEPGGRNLMGLQSPAADAMIVRMLTSESQDDFVAAVKSLDRILTSGRYFIPIYQWNISRLAHDARLQFPQTIPVMGDWPGWQPDVWWWEE